VTGIVGIAGAVSSPISIIHSLTPHLITRLEFECSLPQSFPSHKRHLGTHFPKITALDGCLCLCLCLGLGLGLCLGLGLGLCLGLCLCQMLSG
jgi:hypothetical protein